MVRHNGVRYIGVGLRGFVISERDEFTGRRCVALPIIVQKDEGPSLSLAGPPGFAVFLRDLHSDRRAETEAELFWYYVASPNPWLPMA